jgi:cytoskeletal protein RodZ
VPQKIELPPQKRKFPWSRVIWAVLISLLAVSVVLGALFWYNSRSGQDQGQFFGLFPKRADVESGANTQSTPAPVNNPASQAAPVVNPISTTTPSAATSTAPTAPSAAVTQLKVVDTPTGFLNVRSGPSLNDQILTKVNPGDVYSYTEVKSGWYHIILKDGSTGWVFGQYVLVLK